MAQRIMSTPGKLPPRFLTVSARGKNGRTKYARVDFTGAFDILGEINKAANEELRGALEIAAKSGAEYMKQLIERRSTGWGEFMISQGYPHGPGRNQTGQMSRDVTFRSEAGPKKVYADFGWIENYQKYYGYQETGFRNFGKWPKPLRDNFPFTPASRENWKWTEGMFALFDARQYVKAMAGLLARETAQKVAARGRSMKK